MTIQEIIEQSKNLPAADKWRLVRHLLAELEQGQGDNIPEEDWPTFVARMYGALADDPIERSEQ